MTLRAITLWEPWASLVAHGLKRYETRSWSTSHRGELAIHAAATWNEECADALAHPAISIALEGRGMRLRQDLAMTPVTPREARRYFPLGCIVAVATLEACIEMTEKVKPPKPPELHFGDFSLGRYAWRLTNVRRLPEPVPCKGARQLWDVPADVEARIREQLRTGAAS